MSRRHCSTKNGTRVCDAFPVVKVIDATLGSMEVSIEFEQVSVGVSEILYLPFFASIPYLFVEYSLIRLSPFVPFLNIAQLRYHY